MCCVHYFVKVIQRKLLASLLFPDMVYMDSKVDVMLMSVCSVVLTEVSSDSRRKKWIGQAVGIRDKRRQERMQQSQQIG